MQKLLLRILFAIFFAFFLFFSYSAYQYYLALHSDDPIVPYILVEEWTATVVRWEIAIDMILGDRYDLVEKDTIITGKQSLAVVTWPDKSETRLGASSRLRIERMQVAMDYATIEIEFALEEWQVWSTIVRTIYPGSYFRTKLPGQGVIAWVRGTVYDIDLTRGYIRSVDHSVSLTDRRGNLVNLLPGELVSVTDILKKLGKEVVDQTWSAMNQARDMLYLETHRASLQSQLDKLSGKTWGLWDSFVRWILSFIPTFADLAILESLLSEVPGFENITIPKEKILALYQKIQDTKFVQERDKIRTYIRSQSESLGFDDSYLQTFTRGAIWDQVSFSGMTLQGAEYMVQDYTKTLGAQVQSVMRSIPTGELNTKARETLRQLIK